MVKINYYYQALLVLIVILYSYYLMFIIVLTWPIDLHIYTRVCYRCVKRVVDNKASFSSMSTRRLLSQRRHLLSLWVARQRLLHVRRRHLYTTSFGFSIVSHFCRLSNSCLQLESDVVQVRSSCLVTSVTVCFRCVEGFHGERCEERVVIDE